MLDAVTMIRSRKVYLSVFNRSESGAYRSFLHGMEGDLKALPMGSQHHVSEVVRLRVHLSLAFVQHNFHTAQTYLLVSTKGQEASLYHLRQRSDAHHDCGTGTQHPLRAEAAE